MSDGASESPARVDPLEARRIGLCAGCRHHRSVVSGKGSTFHLCERSRADPSFPKYPRLPVLACTGWEGLPA